MEFGADQQYRKTDTWLFNYLMIYFQYVLVPTRRATGEAVQLMLCHALGEAGAPYIIGVMAGTIENNLVGEPSKNPSKVLKLAMYLFPTFIWRV